VNIIYSSLLDTTCGLGEWIWLHWILSVSKFHFLHPETNNKQHELYITCHRVNIPNSNNIHTVSKWNNQQIFCANNIIHEGKKWIFICVHIVSRPASLVETSLFIFILFIYLFTSFVINDWWSLQGLLPHSQGPLKCLNALCLELRTVNFEHKMAWDFI
jgi:hypothetical protein